MESNNEKRIERKRKQKMLEEKWEMMRWITAFIDENQEEWESQKRLRREEHVQKNGAEQIWRQVCQIASKLEKEKCQIFQSRKNQ